MNKTITRQQSKMLLNDLEMKKEKGERLTMSDKILDLFLPVKAGIKKNGLTSAEIAQIFELYDYKEIVYLRAAICNLQSQLVRDGFPTEREFEQIELSRKQRIISESKALSKYLDDDDLILGLCNKLIKECDKQLTLFLEA